MRQALLRFWSDDSATLISIEWVIVATVLILSVATVVIAYRYAVDGEITELRKIFTSSSSRATSSSLLKK